MGHYSTLWIAKNKEKYNEDIDEYLEVKYAIPLFWIALFSKDHIQKYLDEDDFNYYHFQAPIEQSILLFQQRINLWADLYHTEYAHQLAISFLNFLQQFQGYTITVEVNDIIGMYLDYFSNSDEAYEATADMIDIIDLLHDNPERSLPFRHWLPSFNFSSMKTRYFELDGMGEDLLPCPEVNDWLNQNSQNNDKIQTSATILQHKIINPSIPLANIDAKTTVPILEKKSQKQLSKNTLYLCFFMIIIMILYKIHKI